MTKTTTSCCHVLWFQSQGAVTVSLVMDPQYDLLYSGDANGYIWAINSTNGSKLWSYSARSDADFVNFIAGGRRVQYANGLLLFLCGSRLVAITAGPQVGTGAAGAMCGCGWVGAVEAHPVHV